MIKLLDYAFDPETSLHQLTLPLLAFSLADATPNPAHVPGMVKRTARQILSALTHLHGTGISHRDLNPRNIMLDWNGNVQLIDFSTAYAPSVWETVEKQEEMVCQVGTG